MPYPKHYVDDVHKPLHRIKAPRTSRGAWPGSAAQMRDQIARTILKAPEVMVKITNRLGGKGGMRAIRDHLRYISRNGNVAMEGQDGQVIAGANEIGDLTDEWSRSGWGILQNSRHRESFNVMLSMPPGTNCSRCATQHETSRTPSSARTTAMCSPCTTTKHTRVFIYVCRRRREGFAGRPSEYGVEANATARRTRGVRRRYAKQAVVHLSSGRDASIWAIRVRRARGAEGIPFTSFDAWREIGQVFAGSGSSADRRMGVDIADFVRQMQVVQPAPDAEPTRQRAPTPDAQNTRNSGRRSSKTRSHEPNIER